MLGVAAPAAASAATTITISGATASYPLVSLLAQKYVKLHPNKVKFKIAQGGAQVGINDVAAGRVTIGDVSRDPLAATPRAWSSTRSPSTAICVVTNKSNPLSNLTTGAAGRRSSPARRAAGADLRRQPRAARST